MTVSQLNHNYLRSITAKAIYQGLPQYSTSLLLIQITFQIHFSLWHTAKWKSICYELIVLGERGWAAGNQLHWAASAGLVRLLSQQLKISYHVYTEMALQRGVNLWACNHFLPPAFLHLSLFLSGINSSEATQYLIHASPYSPAMTMIMDCLLL